MAKFRIAANAEIDLLTRDEVRGILADWDAEQAARGRGIKTLRFSQGVPNVSINGVAFVIPFSPAAGYVWAVRNFAAQLSASTTTRLYLGDTGTTGQTNTPLAQLPAALLPSITFSNTQLTLNEGEYLAFVGGGAANLTAYTLQVLQTPAELAWKLN